MAKGKTNRQAHDLLQQAIAIEAKHLRDLGALVADRIDQDPGDVSVDMQTGAILGLLSEAAKAARYAIARRIVQKGGEDPGWGF